MTAVQIVAAFVAVAFIVSAVLALTWRAVR